MTSTSSRGGLSLSAILLLALLLLLAGAVVAVWGLSRFPQAVQFLGLAQASEPVRVAAVSSPLPGAALMTQPAAPAGTAAQVATLEARIARIEGMTARAEGSAIRADALLIAFAARRATERGVALGYLEPLLAERFGTTHQRAVATIVTASRRPVRLDQLIADFAALEPQLKAAPPEAGVWQNLRQEIGSLVSIRRADQPSPRPSPTYDRAAARLAAGQVDQALAEAMRLPGIGAAPRWIADARAYVAAQRALDELETAALLAR
jgi:hypothetical protein